MNIRYSQEKYFEKEKPVWISLKEKRTDVRFEMGDDKASILSFGIGDQNEMNRRKLHVLFRKIVRTAKQHKIKHLALHFTDFSFSKIRIPQSELAEMMALNFLLAEFEFTHYKTPPKDGWNEIDTITVVGNKNIPVEKGLAKGEIIGNEVNTARILANTPGGDMTPELLAQAAIGAARSLPIKIRILEKEQMEKLGMGGVLGVAKGSVERPKFIIMEYRGRKTGKPVVLVGKGVTFDTGGLNIKTGDYMLEMNMDMTGGAAVIHTICALAALKVKKNIIALIPSVENMPSGTSYRPGDIIKTMSGKTIEVMNTDAEGRIILADALTYAKKYQPRLVIDVATLTGAAMVALGQKASALFTKDPAVEKKLRAAGEATGDYVWPLPLWDEYENDIKGTFGDVSNTGKTRYGGAITAAAFLYQFAKEYPWAHIDIAPRMTSTEGEYLAKGSVGASVPLLVRFLERY